MSLMKIQFGKMESTITEQGKTITVLTQENAALTAKIAEYERRLGLSGTTANKATRSSKVRAHNV